MIALTGMPGCGKTTVAQALGRLQHQHVTDVDEVLLSRHGHLLGTAPTAEDWARFRAVEREIVLDLAAHADGVLALSGGAWIDPDVRAALRPRWRTVYLRCSLDTLVERNLGSHRLLFGDGDLRTALRDLLERREKDYWLADLTVVGEGSSSSAVAARILRSIRSEPSDGDQPSAHAL